MSVLVTAIIEDAADVLLDPNYDRWEQTYHLESANEAERQALIFKPDVYVVTSSFVLVQGTRQTFPVTAVQQNTITRNMGADGTIAGDSITLIDRKDIDAMRPDWHSSIYESSTVKHYMFDDRDPNKFFVYPAQPAVPSYVEVICGTYPTPLVISDYINLDDIYRDTIKHYLLYRAYSMDAASSQFAAQRAVTYWNMFVTSLDRKDLVERTYSPKMRVKNGD